MDDSDSDETFCSDYEKIMNKDSDDVNRDILKYISQKVSLHLKQITLLERIEVINYMKQVDEVKFPDIQLQLHAKEIKRRLQIIHYEFLEFDKIYSQYTQEVYVSTNVESNPVSQSNFGNSLNWLTNDNFKTKTTITNNSVESSHNVQSSERVNLVGVTPDMFGTNEESTTHTKMESTKSKKKRKEKSQIKTRRSSRLNKSELTPNNSYEPMKAELTANEKTAVGTTKIQILGMEHLYITNDQSEDTFIGETQLASFMENTSKLLDSNSENIISNTISQVMLRSSNYVIINNSEQKKERFKAVKDSQLNPADLKFNPKMNLNELKTVVKKAGCTLDEFEKYLVEEVRTLPTANSGSDSEVRRAAVCFSSYRAIDWGVYLKTINYISEHFRKKRKAELAETKFKTMEDEFEKFENMCAILRRYKMGSRENSDI